MIRGMFNFDSGVGVEEAVSELKPMLFACSYALVRIAEDNEERPEELKGIASIIDMVAFTLDDLGGAEGEKREKDRVPRVLAG